MSSPFESAIPDIDRFNNDLTRAFILAVAGLGIRLLTSLKYFSRPKPMKKLSMLRKIVSLVAELVSVALRILGVEFIRRNNYDIVDLSSLDPTNFIPTRDTIIFESIFLCIAVCSFFTQTGLHWLIYVVSLSAIGASGYLISLIIPDFRSSYVQFIVNASLLCATAALTILVAVFSQVPKVQQKPKILLFTAILGYMLVLACVAFSLYIYIERSLAFGYMYNSFCRQNCNDPIIRYFWRMGGKIISIVFILYAEWAAVVGLQIVQLLYLSKVIQNESSQ